MSRRRERKKKGVHPAVAVLILMEKRGFEGPDGRYLAVTTHAAQQR